MDAVLRARQAALGAAFGEVAGVEVPRRYGDTLAEYRAVREAVGVVDRRDLAQLRLWGREPVKMLHGLVTNDLLAAPAGRGVYATMLSPKGRVIAELRAFVRARPGGTEVLVDVPREALAGTVEHLRKFVPPLYARWEDASEKLGALGAYGPRSRELVTRALAADVPPLDEDQFVELPFGDDLVLVAGTRYAGGEEGFDLFAASDSLPALWDALLAEGVGLGARPVGYAALETLRIEAGRPRYGHELTEETIPTEAFESTGLMPRAISFTKGCYTGQEVIVRIAHRGHVNRHLRGLLLGDAPLPAPGTALLHPETAKPVGRVTSTAHAPRVGQTVALAYVRRELGPGDLVRLEGMEEVEARVTTLPLVEEGDGGSA